MCGIVGIIGKSSQVDIHLMREEVSHRGPDDWGGYTSADGRVQFGHTRLAILDLEHGLQPMQDQSGNYILIYNGEIFNSSKLRAQLQAEGIKFRTENSDTEVLLNGYIHFGRSFFKNINGMFSFAIYDRKKSIVVLARDHFGIKPLYYCVEKEGIRFSSELTKSQRGIHSIDPNSISDFFTYQFIPAPHSAFQSIHKIKPGEVIEIDTQTLKCYEYSLAEECISSKKVSGFSNEKLKEILTDSVMRWMQSDVEIAFSLSGGLDSSIIVALAASHTNKLNTYTLGFTDIEIDERVEAKSIAEKYKTNHTEILLTEEQLAEDIPEIISCLDEPYAGGLPSWYIYKEVGKRYKVCVTGTGGDEHFGNYQKWKAFNDPINYLRNVRRYIRNGGTFSEVFSFPISSMYTPSVFPHNQKLQGLFCEDFARKVSRNNLRCLSNRLKKLGGGKYQFKNLDLTFQLSDEFLYVTDRFSMHHGVEARTPFLDQQVSSYLEKVSPGKVLNTRDYKRILKTTFDHYLTPEVLKAKKRGFILPETSLLRKYLINKNGIFFDEEYLNFQGIFSAQKVKELKRKFYSNQKMFTKKLWTYIMFQLWYMSKNG